MATFAKFIASIQADGNDGKAFEHFCKWFLLNDPYWKSQVDNAWLFSEWPDRWGPDNGVDLIFKHKNGEMWAVQAKCYDAKHRVSKSDMDSFLTESNRAVIKHRLLFASTNTMGRNAQRACTGQEKPVTLYLLKDFEAAQIEYPSHISELTSAKPKSKPVPDPHQTRAIKDVVSKIGDHDRGQLIMACGTGKTFTTLWIKEALAAQTTLVLVPSLNLLSQTLNEWAFAANDSFDALCVCSDKTVGKRDKEDMALAEAPFSVTSDLSVISDFISNDGHKVIFCTYQSSDLIAEVQSDNSINPFDLVIADEAHRCSGKSDAAFSKVLDSEAIRATKRLFTTATPRLYSSNVKKATANRGIDVYGMDDEAVFGPVLHTLTFGQAIAEDLLNDYQVVIVGVDQPMIKEWIDNQELLGINPNKVTDARTLAAKIGLIKAIKDYDLTRVISFHNRVTAARDFAAEVSELVGLIEPSNRPKGTIWSSFVSGAMRTTDRIIEIGKLKSLESADIGILANAKCLSEGVDVPSLDGIAFIDPKGSQVDIIQAVGRAIRKLRSATKQTKGTIVLPVFIEEGDDVEKQIEASNFKPVWDVLKALRSHDEVLADHLDQYRNNMAKRAGNARQTLDDRIIFELPITVDPNFSPALSTVLVEATTASWEFWIGLLEYFVERHGHADVPIGFELNGSKLGQWVSDQRKNFKLGKINNQRIEKLNQLGFVWNVLDYRWNIGLLKLKAFHERNGHILVQQGHLEDGFNLGSWVSLIRKNRKKNLLSPDKIMELDQIGFCWDVLSERWEEHYQALLKYSKREGNCLVNQKYKVGNINLGTWVNTQRQNYRRKVLSEARINALENIGFVWDPVEALWELGFQKLSAFKKANGHCKVPRKHQEKYFKLGSWVSSQRQFRDQLSTDKQVRLDALGFSWAPDDEHWETGFEKLLKFKLRTGHLNVPRSHSEDGFRLGTWAQSQRDRSKLNELQAEKKQKLVELGFDLSPLDTNWDKKIELLKAFIDREGHCVVPRSHQEEGINLGQWVKDIRYKRQKLKNSRVVELNKLGFSWKI